MNVATAGGAAAATAAAAAATTTTPDADVDASSTPPAPVPRPRKFPCVGDAPGPRCGHMLMAITGPDGNLASARLVLFGTLGEGGREGELREGKWDRRTKMQLLRTLSRLLCSRGT